LLFHDRAVLRARDLQLRPKLLDLFPQRASFAAQAQQFLVLISHPHQLLVLLLELLHILIFRAQSLQLRVVHA
jgi:hypothetical protein